MRTALFFMAICLSPLTAQQISGWVATRVVGLDYPRIALQAQISGAVHVRLTVDKNGRVQKVQAVSGNSILLSAARENLVKWQFSYLPDKAKHSSGSEELEFAVMFKLEDTGETSTSMKFIYQFPGSVIVSASAPHWQP